jgi:hypothetical protein
VTRRTAPRIAWLGAAAILVAAALVALGAILRGDFSDTDGRILGTLAAVQLVATPAGPIDPRLARGERLLLRRRI